MEWTGYLRAISVEFSSPEDFSCVTQLTHKFWFWSSPNSTHFPNFLFDNCDTRCILQQSLRPDENPLRIERIQYKRANPGNYWFKMLVNFEYHPISDYCLVALSSPNETILIKLKAHTDSILMRFSIFSVESLKFMACVSFKLELLPPSSTFRWSPKNLQPPHGIQTPNLSCRFFNFDIFFLLGKSWTKNPISRKYFKLYFIRRDFIVVIRRWCWIQTLNFNAIRLFVLFSCFSFWILCAA